MKFKHNLRNLIVKPSYKLHISNDYEHVHIYKLDNGVYVYNETVGVHIFRALLQGAAIASTMSNKAKCGIIAGHTRMRKHSMR